ncbi:HlyD family efflux transporter periplasmic adaptor subunit [archaeon]|nr:HlyD family efflux transporter periplasmic adaptor subunit [archaeon]
MKAEAEHYRSYLADHSLVSPINGIVVERIRREGESVDVGTPVLKLINPGKMRVRAELEESDVGKVKEGDAVDVTCDSYPGKVFSGKVKRVFPFVQRREQKTFDPIASFDINTQRIYLSLDDFTGLKDGMTVTLRFKK